MTPALGFVGNCNDRILPFTKPQSFCRKTRSLKGGWLFEKSPNLSEISDGKKSLDSIDARIREAGAQDLKAISSILTNEFFGKFNPLEWLQTYFSLQDSFPEAQKSGLYCTFVAYRESSEEIIGYCEVDCRPNSNSKAAPRPYMCNLAVKNRWKRNGIGTALIEVCEEKVANEWCQGNLHLRVRRQNSAALGLYTKMGYIVIDEDGEYEENRKKRGNQEKDANVITLKKVLSSK